MKNFREQVGWHHPLRKAVSLVYRIKMNQVVDDTDVFQQKSILQRTHTICMATPNSQQAFCCGTRSWMLSLSNQQFYLAYDY